MSGAEIAKIRAAIDEVLDEDDGPLKVVAEASPEPGWPYYVAAWTLKDVLGPFKTPQEAKAALAKWPYRQKVRVQIIQHEEEKPAVDVTTQVVDQLPGQRSGRTRQDVSSRR